MRFADVEAVTRLIANRIPESASLEYKSELSLDARAARKELLKDLTGMANGGGGTVIFGLQEEAARALQGHHTAGRCHHRRADRGHRPSHSAPAHGLVPHEL
jgi:predicted HTH transcriptional regulator